MTSGLASVAISRRAYRSSAGVDGRGGTAKSYWPRLDPPATIRASLMRRTREAAESAAGQAQQAAEAARAKAADAAGRSQPNGAGPGDAREAGPPGATGHGRRPTRGEHRRRTHRPSGPRRPDHQG